MPESLGTVSALSTDGQIAAGAAFVIISTPSGPREVPTTFRWTPSGGTEVLLNNDGTVFRAGAITMTPDGTTILSGLGSFLYTWRASTGYVLLPGITANEGISIPDISGDGNTVVSMDKVWNASTGTLPLTTVLASAGCNFSGWSNLIVSSTDFSGHTLCGYGTDPQGLTEAWYATVPAPASALSLLALPLLARRRRSDPFTSCAGERVNP